jgi:hypothetical protein
MFETCADLEACAYRKGIRVRAYEHKVGDSRPADFWKTSRKLFR